MPTLVVFVCGMCSGATLLLLVQVLTLWRIKRVRASDQREEP